MGRHIVRNGENQALQVEMDAQLATVTHTTVAAVAGAATLNKGIGTVVSESLTTAALSTYTLTLTNNMITAASIVFANVQLSAPAETGLPQIVSITAVAGSVSVIIKNIHATAAFDGTLEINYVVF